jgi:hypothetical protein
MRLSPQLLSIVAGTAAITTSALTIGCTESRAAAEAPVAQVAPVSAPAPIMRPIDFEAPPPVVAVTQTAPAVTEPIVLEAPLVTEADTQLTSTEVASTDPVARPHRAPRRNAPDISTVPVPVDEPYVGLGNPDFDLAAAACGRG